MILSQYKLKVILEDRIRSRLLELQTLLIQVVA